MLNAASHPGHHAGADDFLTTLNDTRVTYDDDIGPVGYSGIWEQFYH